ncbi:MAG: hypothetical protein ACI9FU_001532 [Granulosicoccus sp.]|jgi:hypothetical protein
MLLSTRKKGGFAKNHFNMERLKLLTVFLGLMAFVSCTRCSDCENNGVSDRICEQDFDDPNAYNAAIVNQEADGAECVAVI